MARPLRDVADNSNVPRPLTYRDQALAGGRTLINIDAVDNYLNTLWATPIGSCFGQPTYGFKGHRLLFQPCLPRVGSDILSAMLEAIRIWLPVIQVYPERSQVLAVPLKQHWEVALAMQLQELGDYTHNTTLKKK